jgi:3'(2'), 5'-bisphosphate nucleotidase
MPASLELDPHAHVIPSPTETTPAADDALLAATLAAGAGQVLLELRERVDDGTIRGDDAALRAAADGASQAYLMAELARARPGDIVLSEEAPDDRRRLVADRVWIIDPLDGTREYAERTADGAWRDDFAVHVALWQRGQGLTDAAVALPARGVVHRTGTSIPCTAPPMTTADGRRRPVRLAVSRSRPPAFATRLEAGSRVELFPLGSAGVKVMAVTDGTVDAYVHAGGQYEWDSAAPVAIAIAAGMVAQRLDGSPLVYNQANPWCPDLVICRPEWLETLETMLAADGLAEARANP